MAPQWRPSTDRRRWITGLTTLSCALLVGCAATATVTPNPGQKVADCQIRSPVWFEGKPEYVPEVLIADASMHGAGFRYSFQAQYGLSQYNGMLAAVNPLSLVGFPTGTDSVVVTGRIDLLRGQTVERTYAAAASLKVKPTIFGEGESFTEMRLRGLMLVRENLSAQLCEDQVVLRQLLQEPDLPDRNPT